MNIESISSITGMSKAASTPSSSNGEAFDKLWDTITEMSQNQKTADAQMRDVLLGKSDDATGALIALQKNEGALSMAVIVRDKLIDGTKKILDMQM